MPIPTISQYAESVCNPQGRFRTLGEPVCEHNAYGEPRLAAGGHAAVFRIMLGGRPHALKCYIRPGKRNDALYDHLATHRFPLLYETRYLPRELYVYGMDGSGDWYDVLLTPWAEGVSLGRAVRKALHEGNGQRLAELSRNFDAMAARLLAMPWAHGDLKPENLVVEPSGSLRLLDYDAMFIPGVPLPKHPETGTPQFNHPARDASFVCKAVDDYPIALLSATLHTLAADPALAHGTDLSDRPLFDPAALFAHRSATYTEALTAAAKRGDAITYRLLSLLLSPVPELQELGGIIRHAAGDGRKAAARTAPEPFVRGGVWGYESEGTEVIPPLFDSALRFTEDIAIVELGGFRHFIDPTGRTVINGSRYDHLKPFRNGAAAVRCGTRWSHIDRSGSPVEPPATSAPQPSLRRERQDEPRRRPSTSGETKQATTKKPIRCTTRK